MANIIIYATSNVSQDSLICTDQTDWTSLGVPRSTLTSLVLNLYETSLVTPEYQYTLSGTELSAFIADGIVEIPFLSSAGTIYIEDAWWNAVLTGNSGAYVSNYSGFGIYASITYAVFNQVNGLHVPEEIKFDAEKYATSVFFLEGLVNLDTTNVNSRGVKFQKRLISLQKMLLNI
jgi:hypothetical protein